MQKEKLAIIVPYRDRAEHRKEFVPYMEQYIKGIDYTIFFIEQGNSLPFNRATLLNIGFQENLNEYDYFVFHDVDLIPVDADYSYNKNVTRIASGYESFNWQLPYPESMGGVVMFEKKSFLEINGFSNNYWGWGREDDELYMRVIAAKIPITDRHGLYRALKHFRMKDDALLEYNTQVRAEAAEKFKKGDFSEGLSTTKYTVVKKKAFSEQSVVITVDFEMNAQVNYSSVKYNLKDKYGKFRFWLGKTRRQIMGKKL